MTEFKVGFDNTRQKKEPDSAALKRIEQVLLERPHRVNQNNVKSFVNLVGENGCTFCPATFNASFDDVRISEEIFQQQQLFVLGFNGDISFEKVKERSERYDLPIMFAYKPLSSEDSGSFRISLLNDVPITDRRAARIYNNLLMAVFPEADKSDKDITKVYAGGKELLYYDPVIPTLDIDTLSRNFTIYLIDKNGIKNYRRELHKFSQRNRVALNKGGTLSISIVEDNAEKPDANQLEEISPTPIILSITDGEISSKKKYMINLTDPSSASVSSVEGTSAKESKNHKEHRSSDLSKLSRNCQLYKEFESGSRRLDQLELLGIATNMIHIEALPGIASVVDKNEKT